MAISGMSLAGFHASGQQAVQSLSLHKYGGHRGHSLSDVDAISSSVASAPSKTGKIASKIDVTA
jgi:hypothetical protein